MRRGPHGKPELSHRAVAVGVDGFEREQVMRLIGDHEALASAIRNKDWNEYTAIARRPTLIYIITAGHGGDE